MNDNISVFLIDRRTVRHSLNSNECGWARNFLISVKADLRQTRVYSSSPSFCIVSVDAGFLEEHISELNPHLLPIILLWSQLNYFPLNFVSRSFYFSKFTTPKIGWAILPLLSVWVPAIQAAVQDLLVSW
jgi:hypothetical protein